MTTTASNHNWFDQFRSNFQDVEISPLEEGATALMYACQQENIEQLQAILRRKPEAVRERDRTLKTVLHYCAENVTLRCAEIILNEAPDIIDVADEDGYTTLHLAVIAGNLSLVNFLISRSADITALDSEQHSVIHWATVCGEVELLEILLKCNADPSTPDVHGGYPIHYAAQMCGAISEMTNDSKLGLTVLKVLINHADVNVVDHDGRQPLLWAASAGSSNAVIALINAGASVRAHDKDGLTALHCAASRGHTDCLETLIELCAAEVDVTDNNGCSPLFYSVTLGHADATQLLLQYGADPNRQDRKGRSPAHCGAAKGQLETLKILKKHGGNLWLKNLRGDYCLNEAVNSGRKDLVKWLLTQRPDAVNSSNLDGRCPLHIAASSNNIEMCKILLDYQSLVNPVMKTNRGDLMTPLDAALYKGNRGCAKYLQLHGGVPGSKLTSYSAAIRGPHRIETHSDYQGSPDGKLDAPYQSRGTRSLDTSPLGYQSESRKVQVCIRANLSSENIHEAFSNCNRHHRRRRKYDHKDHRNHYIHWDDGGCPERRSFSSSNESSTDISEISSETDHKLQRRRRRRRQYSSQTTHSRSGRSSRSRSQSCCRRSTDEQNKVEKNKNKPKVRFQNEKGEKNNTNEGIKMNDISNQHTVTAVIHKENEKKENSDKTGKINKPDTEESKPNESSENGVPEIPFQKMDADMDVISQENKPELTAEKIQEEKIKNNDDHSNEKKTDKSISDDRSSTFTEEKNKEIIPKVEEKKQEREENESANNTDAKSSKENISSGATVTWSDLQNNEISEEPETAKLKSPRNDDGDVVTIEPFQIDHMDHQENTDKPSDSQSPSVKTFSNDTLPSKEAETVSDGKPHGESPISSERLPENIEKTFNELEKLKEDKLEQNLTTKDKGLICVILDDDETIEIKRKRDINRSKSEHHPRPRSASRKREKNLQKRQRRSRSSFEILSDDSNNEDYSSRLTVQDDSGFEPSPRHSGQAKSKGDVSNKTKSRIPRATNSYQSQSEKQNENNPDINVTSVTQAVQNSLRKYNLERKIFHTLLELKRLQIRAGKSNEQVLVKRLVDDYQKAGLIVGLRPYDGVYSFGHFEKYLYEQLRILQIANKKDIPRIKSSDDFDRLTKALKRTRSGKTLLENVPDNPLFCTHGTHRCLHATHAYTGIPCAAYIAKLDHHKLPKPNENYRCFLPRIDNKNASPKNYEEIAKSLRNVDPSKPVTLELTHGTEKQIISLPTENLDKNKRYYVTFTIKGGNNNHNRSSSEGENFQNTSNMKSNEKT